MERFPELRDLQLFCAVVRCGSFVQTATELGVSTSYVSKRIGILEGTLGCRLLHRAARQATMTDDGEAIHLWARRLLDQVEEMRGAVNSLRNEPKGDLRISTSFRLGRNLIAPALSRLVRRHPKLDISLIVVDRPVDLIAEEIDLDIRIGDVPEPHLIAHRLADSPRILCASPDYLERRGTPATVADLRTHACLVFRERDQPFGTWRLRGPGGEVETVKVSGELASNTNDIIRQWALAGHGIIRAAAWDCRRSLEAGELVRVLPGYDWPTHIWAVTPARLSQSAKIRVCVQFLKDWLAESLDSGREAP